MVKKGLALILSHNIKWFINKHFSNHFVQPVNSSKKSILNLVKKLNFIHLFFFSFLFWKYLWEIFHSIHLFFLLFGLDTYKLA